MRPFHSSGWYLANGVSEVVLRDDIVGQPKVAIWQPRKGRPPQVHDQLHNLQAHPARACQIDLDERLCLPGNAALKLSDGNTTRV